MAPSVKTIKTHIYFKMCTVSYIDGYKNKPQQSILSFGFSEFHIVNGSSLQTPTVDQNPSDFLERLSEHLQRATV
ncbi:hypothetical protein NTGBS_470020 [Candidatus Nitrotoga sp. BS]|nr:hypothetical protein NTGBS_470020 [Candidatus Nitrotoga sp. BS]